MIVKVCLQKKTSRFTTRSLFVHTRLVYSNPEIGKSHAFAKQPHSSERRFLIPSGYIANGCMKWRGEEGRKDKDKPLSASERAWFRAILYFSEFHRNNECQYRSNQTVNHRRPYLQATLFCTQ